MFIAHADPFDTQRFSFNFTFTRYNMRFSACEDLSNYGIWNRGNGPGRGNAEGIVPTPERTFGLVFDRDAQQNFVVDEDWHLPDGWIEGIDFFRRIGRQRRESLRCDILVTLERNPAVYMIKQAALDILVVISGLCATLLDPKTPPYFGARCAMLMTSMLMTINKSARRELGLGRLRYMLVLDWFAVFNILMLLLALACTIAIHFLTRHGRKVRGVTAWYRLKLGRSRLSHTPDLAEPLLPLRSLSLTHRSWYARQNLATTCDQVLRWWCLSVYFLALLGFYLYIKSGDGGATAAYVSIVSVTIIGGAIAYIAAVLQ